VEEQKITFYLLRFVFVSKTFFVILISVVAAAGFCVV
jgi:hypothetical protein